MKKKLYPKLLRIIFAAISLLLTVSAFLFTHKILYGWLGLQLGPRLVQVFTSFTAGALATAAAAALSALIFGRVYCAIICPLGILQDLIGFFNPRKYKKFIYNYAKTRLALALLSFALLIAGWAAAFYALDPYSIFARLDTALINPVLIWAHNLVLSSYPVSYPGTGISFILLGGVFTLVLLVALVIWTKRIFCTTICPAGTFLGMFAKYSFMKLKIDRSACIHCMKCAQVCPAGCIDIESGTILDNALCLRCMNCVSACPARAIGAGVTAGGGVGHDMTKRDFVFGGILAALTFGAGKLLKPGAGLGQKAFARNFIVPPGAGSPERFLSKCTACGLCVSNCQGNVLSMGGKFKNVHLEFGRGFCDFSCTNCSKVCPTGAIDEISLNQKRMTRIGLASLELPLCVTVTNGTECGACSEQCPTGALQMEDTPNGARLPVFNEAICIGCGACENACPVVPRKAVIVNAVPLQVQAQDPVEYFRSRREALGLDSTPQSDEWLF
jgi:ferredoxin